jgi:hypothetical protein
VVVALVEVLVVLVVEALVEQTASLVVAVEVATLVVLVLAMAPTVTELVLTPTELTKKTLLTQTRARALLLLQSFPSTSFMYPCKIITN